MQIALVVLAAIGTITIALQWRRGRAADRARGIVILKYPDFVRVPSLLISAAWPLVFLGAPHLFQLDGWGHGVETACVLMGGVSFWLSAHLIGYRFRVSAVGVERTGGLLRRRTMPWSDVTGVDWHITWDCLMLRKADGATLRLNSFLTPLRDLEVVMREKVGSEKISSDANAHLEKL